MPKKRKNKRCSSVQDHCVGAITCGGILAIIVGIIILIITSGSESLHVTSFSFETFIISVCVTGVGGTGLCYLLEKCCRRLASRGPMEQMLITQHVRGINYDSVTEEQELQVQIHSPSVDISGPQPLIFTSCTSLSPEPNLVEGSQSNSPLHLMRIKF